MLGFQTSQGSTGDEAKVTMNLMVVGKVAWKEARARNSYLRPNQPYLDRFSSVCPACWLPELSHGRDHWWRLAGAAAMNGSSRMRYLLGLALLREVIAPKLKTEIST